MQCLDPGGTYFWLTKRFSFVIFSMIQRLQMLPVHVFIRFLVISLVFEI